jgi:hypothetical protein
MHARVPQVLAGRVVAHGGEPDQALLVEVDAQRVIGGDGYIQAEVPLVAVDEQRIVDVFGYNLHERL